MSISSSGVKIQKRSRNYWLLIILTFVELVFSVLLVVSLASNLLFPQRASAVAGVSAKLSYQGRLTDLSGNPLGGSGTNYCFRFSIYDAASGGAKVWPSGAPNSTTVKVEDGVFNTDLGTADSLATLDFSANDTIYLNVEVNATPTTCGGSWEQLDLRQRIDSVGYARAAEGVYSALLRAPTGGTAVQIGTGVGAATPIFLNLDVKNTQEAVDASCTTNGQLWYNSADSRARVCQGSVIRDMIDGLMVQEEGSNVGRASVALDFRGANVTASNMGNGVIQISISAGAGGGATLSNFEYPSGNFADTQTMVARGSSHYVFPFVLPQAMSASYIRIPVSFGITSTSFGTTSNAATTFSHANTVFAVIYTQLSNGNSLSLGSYTSTLAQWIWQVSASNSTNSGSRWTQTQYLTYPIKGGTAGLTSTFSSALTRQDVLTTGLTAFTATKYLDIPFNVSLSPGNYWMAVMNSSTTAGGKGLAWMATTIALSQMNAAIGNLGAATNSSLQLQIGLGSWSTNAINTTASIALSGISSVASQLRPYFQIIRQS